MFDNYPKSRPKLPKSILSIYKKHYKMNREGKTKASGMAQKMEAWLHRVIASDVRNIHNKKTLEIGAGTLNQLAYEESDHYDIIEPFTELYSDSKLLSKINNIYKDIDEIDLSQKYDRITSIATFEHITDLPKVVAKSCILLEQGGSLRTSIPNEGSFLWKLGWQLTTGLEFKLKYNLDYGALMKHEHVNNADEIEQILNYFYSQNKCLTFGIGKTFSLYRYYQSKHPNIELAKAYLESLENKQ